MDTRTANPETKRDNQQGKSSAAEHTSSFPGILIHPELS